MSVYFFAPCSQSCRSRRWGYERACSLGSVTYCNDVTSAIRLDIISTYIEIHNMVLLHVILRRGKPLKTQLSTCLSRARNVLIYKTGIGISWPCTNLVQIYLKKIVFPCCWHFRRKEQCCPHIAVLTFSLL